MAKLTKAQAKMHLEACERLKKDVLTEDDKWFVLEHWQESANHVNSIAGAFFTPVGLANDFAIEVAGHRIIDLCAGIGALSFMRYQRGRWGECYPDITCVELNPAYVEVGKKILPEANWICGSVFDLPDLGRFDYAISNPPFGATPRKSAGGPRYTGSKFEYHVIDVASLIADFGVFIIPQMSAPFRYSGQPYYREDKSDEYLKFSEQTGVEMGPSCGIDCEYHRDGWHGVSVAVEVVVCEFPQVEAAEVDLFGEPLERAA